MSYRYPYTNLHEINLDKFMKAIKALTGGSGNQLLKKKSNTDFDFEWVNAQTVGPVQSVNGKTGNVDLNASDVGAIPDSVKPVLSVNNTLPDANGNVDSGDVKTVNNIQPDNTGDVSITAANVGAIASPASPASGDFLVYNGSAWVAMALSVWQGGNY